MKTAYTPRFPGMCTAERHVAGGSAVFDRLWYFELKEGFWERRFGGFSRPLGHGEHMAEVNSHRVSIDDEVSQTEFWRYTPLLSGCTGVSGFRKNGAYAEIVGEPHS